jgi:Ca-activated chloride channel family protein
LSVLDSLGWIEGLPLLVLVPAAAIALSLWDRRRSRRVRALVGQRVGAIAGEVGVTRRRRRRHLVVAGATFACVAALQPLWGEGSTSAEQRGVDVLVCLDVSRSMLARDVAPDRLRRAKQDIRQLAQRIRGDRMGLVVFAGEARLVVPLTQDLDSLLGMLELVDPGSVERGGTDLGAALDLARAALRDQTGDHEVVLLITDGEDLEGRGLRAAEACRERGITVHAIGVGSPEGSKIPLSGAGGETFLQDAAGQDVVSALSPESLRRIAQTTGGDYVDVASHPLPLVSLHERHVRPMARKALESRRRRTQENRFQWPLLVAYSLWILELSFSDRRRRRSLVALAVGSTQKTP